jgi:hypothetical protein
VYASGEININDHKLVRGSAEDLPDYLPNPFINISIAGKTDETGRVISLVDHNLKEVPGYKDIDTWRLEPWFYVNMSSVQEDSGVLTEYCLQLTRSEAPEEFIYVGPIMSGVYTYEESRILFPLGKAKVDLREAKEEDFPKGFIIGSHGSLFGPVKMGCWINSKEIKEFINSEQYRAFIKELAEKTKAEVRRLESEAASIRAAKVRAMPATTHVVTLSKKKKSIKASMQPKQS